MRTYYLDSGALFRLAQEPALSTRLIDLQRSRRFRIAIGYRTIWEAAGVLVHKPDESDRVMNEAQLVLDLLQAGGVLTKDGWKLSLEGLTIAPSKRHPYRLSPVFPRGTPDYQRGVSQLRVMADGKAKEKTIEWYETVRRAFDPAEYAIEQKRFEQLIRGDAPREGADAQTLRENLNHYQRVGKMAEVADATARRIAEVNNRRFASGWSVPPGVGPSWYGPFGFLLRCGMAYTMLHVCKHPDVGTRRATRGDFPDICHIVVAGMLGGFVTNDRLAKIAFWMTWPSRSRTCPHYEDEFIPMLRSDCERHTNLGGFPSRPEGAGS